MRWHTALQQRNEDRQRGPLLAPPCAWGLRAGACKRCGGWFGPNFSAPARVRSKDGPPAVTRACCLRAASQWRLAIVCTPSKVVDQQSATLLRSSSGSAGAGRQAVLTAVICFGLCASEEWGFAYMLRSGSKLVSACNLTLPLVAACSCACVLQSYAPSPRASQDNAIEYEGYERPA